MATCANHNRLDEMTTFRVILPVSVIAVFDGWRRGRVRHIMFGAAMLRMAELSRTDRARAYKRWLLWDIKTRHLVEMRATSFRVHSRIVAMFDRMVDRYTGYRPVIRTNLVASAMFDVPHGPIGQWSDTLEVNCPPCQCAFDRWHWFVNGVDDDYVDTLRRIWGEAGEEPPVVDVTGRPPVEPTYRGLAQYARNGGCLADTELSAQGNGS